jgi:hypothetical protein
MVDDFIPNDHVNKYGQLHLLISHTYDFIADLSLYQTMVETAYGGLVEKCRKMELLTVQHNKMVMVYPNDVLHVPLLS